MTHEGMQSITTTQLARNLSATIDQVRMQRRGLTITKGRQTVATLTPPPRNGFPTDQLSELLASVPHLDEDAVGMADDLLRIRKQSALPDDPWDS